MRNCPDITILNYCFFIHGHIHGLVFHLGISHGVGHGGLDYVLVMPLGVSHFQSSFRSNVSRLKSHNLCPNSKVAAVPDGYLLVPDGYLPVPDGYLHVPDGYLLVPDGYPYKGYL